MKISQSMLKMFQKYLQGEECGVQFKAKYITESMPEKPPTESQEGGNWFEFMATGSTPRGSGRIPEPVRIKSGELNAMYKNLSAHLPMWEKLKPAGARYGEVLVNETAVFGHTLTGITDVITDDMIGDIKTTAFIDNKWEEYGWGGDPEYIADRPAMMQAKYYVLITWLNTGKILPFTFWIFANNSDKCKQIHVTMTEAALVAFKSEVEYLIGAIENDDFAPVPSFSRCRDCLVPCASKQELPDTITINY